MPLNVTAPKVLTITTTTAKTAAATHTAEKVANAAAHAAAHTGFNMFQLAVAAVILLLSIIIASAIFGLKKRGSIPVSAGGTNLANVFKNQAADAIGIIINISTNEVKFVPLRRVGGMYMYMDNNVWKTLIPIKNNYLKLFGRPALLGLEYDRSSIEVDPEPLAAFGIGAASNEELETLLESDYDKSKTLVKLLTVATKLSSKLTGKLRMVDGVAIEVYPVRLIRSVINYVSTMNRAAVAAQHGLWLNIEGSAKAMQQRMGWLSNPNVGRNVILIAVALMIVVIAIFLGKMFGALAP